MDLSFSAEYEKFRAESCAKLLAIEERLQHPHLAIAGTLDRRFEHLQREVVVDLKATATLNVRATEIQLAGYEELRVVNRPGARPKRPMPRKALHLRPNGTYKLVPCASPWAQRVFYGAYLEVSGQGTADTRALIARWKDGTL